MEQVEPVNDTLLLTEWQALLRQTSPEVHTLLTSLSDEEIRHLVTVFYDYMLSHAESALFLNTEQVSTRLSGSMFDWLRSVLGSATKISHNCWPNSAKLVWCMPVSACPSIWSTAARAS